MATDPPRERRSPQRRSQTILVAGERVGNYVIERPLGSGGQAQVFLARDVVLRRLVALKVFTKSGATVEGLDEARLIAKLDHPNIVRIHHVEMNEGTWYTAMEYVDGGNVESRVLRVGPLKPVDALRITLAAADALQHAHQIGVTHRDIKPQNILISRGEIPKLADFGLAGISANEEHLGPSARWFGTPAFMAPEVWQGERGTARSDIYALAGTLFFMLTGKPPFEGDNVDVLRKAHLQKEIPFPKEMPRALVRLIRRAMAKRASDRPTTAQGFYDEIEQAIGVLTGAKVEKSTPTPDQDSFPILDDGAVLNADLAVLEIPPFSTAKSDLERALTAGPPVVLLRGPQAEARERLVHGVFDANPGRFFLAALVLLRTPTIDLMSSIAQRFKLEKLAPSARYDAILGELAPEDANIPGLLQVNVLRPMTVLELANLIELAKKIAGKGAKILLVCDNEIAQGLFSEIELGGYSALVQSIEMPARSGFETAQYIHTWTSRATERRFSWTPDAIRLAVHLEGEGRAPLDKLVRNGIVLAHASGKSLITTWCVLGASAHRGIIHSSDAVDAQWRAQPTSWPSKELLTTLLRLRLDWTMSALEDLCKPNKSKAR